MKTYSDGYSYEEALIDEMDELGFDRTSPIEWSRKTRDVSHEQKLKDALSYLGNKHLIAKDSKFVYTRGHSVGTVILLAGALGKAEDSDGLVAAVEDYVEGMW